MIREITLLILVGVAYVQSYHNTIKEAQVTTPLGQIKGSIIESRLGRRIFSFRGIRYAKAPVDELRFQPPVPVGKWQGLYNATVDGPLCPQPTTDPISEDCLMLNVYSTKLPNGNDCPNRPVAVFLHPGGFYSLGGTSYWFGPNYFMDQDIVLVTVNYRLGTLGFLSTGDREAPGNNGLRDQVVALKWVKENIKNFGGNPDSVTLIGDSAGAWSITLHLVSPMSQGLFHRGISMSGSALGGWTLPKNQLDLAKRQAGFVGCPNDTSANIIKCLKTKSYKELGDSLPQFKEFADDPTLIWSPVIEENFGQQRFLLEQPIKSILNGRFQKVPYITGVTKDEFGPYASIILGNDSYREEMSSNFEKIAPISFQYERNTERSKTISRALRKFYLHDRPLDNSSYPGLSDLYADSLIGFSVNRAVKLISEKSNHPVYYYKFSYQGRYSWAYTPESNFTIPYGVTHQDDLIYLFHIEKLIPLFKRNTPKEVEMVDKLCTLWGNFVKTGNPIPEANRNLDNVIWEPYNTKTQKYLDLDKKLVLREKLYENRYAEWEKLFPFSLYD